MTRNRLVHFFLVALVILTVPVFSKMAGADPGEGQTGTWSVFPSSQYGYGRVWGIDPNGPNGLVGFGTDSGLVTLTPDGIWTLFEREHLTFDVTFWTSPDGRVQFCGAQLNLGAYCVDLTTGEMNPWYQGIVLPERSVIQDPAKLITYIHTLKTDQDGDLWLAGLRCESRYNCESVFVRTNGSWIMVFQAGQPVWVRDAHVYSFVPYRDKFLVDTMWGGVLAFDLYRSNFDPNLIYQPPGQHLFSLSMAVQEDEIVVADLDWLWYGSLLDNRGWVSFRPSDFQDWRNRYPSDQFHRVSSVGNKIWSVIHRTDGSGRLMEYDLATDLWVEIWPPGVTSWTGPTAGPVVDNHGRAWLSWGSIIFMYDPNSSSSIQSVASNAHAVQILVEGNWSHWFEVNRDGEIVFFTNDQMQ